MMENDNAQEPQAPTSNNNLGPVKPSITPDGGQVESSSPKQTTEDATQPEIHEAAQTQVEPESFGSPTTATEKVAGVTASSSALRTFEVDKQSGTAILRIQVTETRLASLPNQKVGEEFSLRIDDFDEYATVEVKALPEGIRFESSSRFLSGTPEKDGQHTVQFLCHKADDTVSLFEYSLVIVPDPRTLWKVIPTDNSAPFWKSDYLAEVDSTADLFAVAASNRGRAHAHSGKFREDDFSMLCIGPSTWSVFAVADGGGSYELSRRGSEIACQVVTKKLPGLLESKLTPVLNRYKNPISDIGNDSEVLNALYESLVQAAFDATDTIEKEAKQHEKDSRSFSTTLLMVAVREFSFGKVVVGFNIGDGASAVLHNGGKDVFLLCEPESGEFAGQTRFLSKSEFQPENDQRSRVKIAVLNSFDAIVVMSDGVSDAKFENDNALLDAKVWQKLIFDDWAPTVLPGASIESKTFDQNLPTIKEKATEWLQYWAPGTHDDRTLIVALPKVK